MMPETLGSSRPSRCQGPSETPSAGVACCCSSTTSVKGVPPQVPVHVPRRSGGGLGGIVSGGVVAQAESTVTSAITRSILQARFIPSNILVLDVDHLRADSLAHNRRIGTLQLRRGTTRSCRRTIPLFVAAALMLGTVGQAVAQTTPAGEVTIAWHVTIAPTWFDPSSAPPQITAFGMLFALHDALVRPLPGKGKMSPSLAEAWTESPDGLVYEFKLRRDLKFHNGDPLTAEDVKFSFERYKGAGAKELQTHVRQVEIVDPLTVRFHLTEPWPDFMTFYGTTATAAGIVVPKKYVSQVGDEGFRKHPIGAGPYKFVSHKPGIEVVLEANAGYWRVVPSIKTLVMK